MNSSHKDPVYQLNQVYKLIGDEYVTNTTILKFHESNSWRHYQWQCNKMKKMNYPNSVPKWWNQRSSQENFDIWTSAERSICKKGQTQNSAIQRKSKWDVCKVYIETLQRNSTLDGNFAEDIALVIGRSNFLFFSLPTKKFSFTAYLTIFNFISTVNLIILSPCGFLVSAPWKEFSTRTVIQTFWDILSLLLWSNKILDGYF